ncbi:MAG: aminodeoxychorismate lyase [Chitinophagaceae bacterium]|nr:MAG: aminodeoxychorismate lyase [Chitinophagaceae bacterium]
MAKKKVKSKSKRSNHKKGYVIISILALVSSLIVYILFLRSSTISDSEDTTILISSNNAEKTYVKPVLKENMKPINFQAFLVLADLFDYWNNIKPGRYKIERNSSIYSIFRKLKGGNQTTVNLIINKFRTKKDLSKFVSNKLNISSSDMYEFLTNKDSLSLLGLNPEQVMTIIIPNTYSIYWNTNPKEFLMKMQKESNEFWNTDRIEKAKILGLSKEEIYIIASIIEEETNNTAEKPKMASVYLNRLKKNMPLGADPTIKFALGDFSIKRITLNDINNSSSSSYNTYKNKGLPPGPICTPSIVTIDAVLKSERTGYLYFCAKPDFSGSHNFANTADQHFENARQYRIALDQRKIH